MTKDALLERKAQAELERDRAVAQANMLNGVLNEINYWLSELDKPVEPDKPDSAPEQGAEPKKA